MRLFPGQLLATPQPGQPPPLERRQVVVVPPSPRVSPRVLSRALSAGPGDRSGCKPAALSPPQTARSSLQAPHVPSIKGASATAASAANLHSFAARSHGWRHGEELEPAPECGQIIWDPQGHQRSSTPLSRAATPGRTPQAALHPAPSSGQLSGSMSLSSSWSPAATAGSSPTMRWRTPHQGEQQQQQQQLPQRRPIFGVGQAPRLQKAVSLHGLTGEGLSSPGRASQRDAKGLLRPSMRDDMPSPPSESQSTAASTPPGFDSAEGTKRSREHWPQSDELDTSSCTEKGESGASASIICIDETPRTLLQECLRQYHEEQRQWRGERAALLARVAELERRQEALSAELAATHDRARGRARRLRQRLRQLARGKMCAWAARLRRRHHRRQPKGTEGASEDGANKVRGASPM